MRQVQAPHKERLLQNSELGENRKPEPERQVRFLQRERRITTMKVFKFTIDDATFFGDDDDNTDTIADEIAYRLNISSSEVYVEETETIKEE